MKDWLVPALLFVMLLPVFSLVARAITLSTRRSRVVKGPWGLVAPLGAGVAVLVVGVLLEPPLPWLALMAGVAIGVLGLVVQFFAGRRAA